jgi:hypothetical protein
MAKKLIAVTNIRHSGEDFEAGSELDTTKFTKEELKSLYDAGAVEVQDGGRSEMDNMSSSASPENPKGQDAQQVGDVPASAKQGATGTSSAQPTSATQPTKSTDAKK